LNLKLSNAVKQRYLQEKEGNTLASVVIILGIIIIIIGSIIGTLVYYNVQKNKYKPLLTDAEDRMKKTLLKIDQDGKDEYV
jgi:uncharacterized Tic20 family protein